MPETKRKVQGTIVVSANAPEDLPILQIAPPKDYMVVPSSGQTLLCGLGMVEDHSVLVPYVQTQLLKAIDLRENTGKDLKLEPAFQATLAFDNLAFLLLDLARDYQNNTTQLAALSTGSLHAEPWRLNYAAECLETASTALTDAVEQMRDLVARAEAASTTPAPRLKPKPATGAAKPLRTSKTAKRPKLT